LQGAAVGLVISGALDMALLLVITLPHIGVSLWQLSACVVRPIVASAAMVAVLWSLDMAWTPSSGAAFLDFGLDAGRRSMIGAVCYAIVLAGIWLIAGRPDGAERYVLTTVGNMGRRLRRRAYGRHRRVGAG
jgi:lipopolysaccharide exporter